MRIPFALTLALLHGTLAASKASPLHQDCGCIWQQEYKSMHAAIKSSRLAQRYTAVSYPDMGKILTHTWLTLQ